MEHGVFRPFGMTDDEYERRLEVREEIPELLLAPMRTWAETHVADHNRYATLGRVYELQSVLKVELGPEGSYTEAESLVAQFEASSEREFVWLVDYLLSEFPEQQWSEPDAIKALRWHMDQTRSALTVSPRGGVYRLTHRLPEGVEATLVSAAQDANASAGIHLSNAIREATTLDGKTSTVMTEGIRAVEAAAGPVVTPRDQRFALSKIVSALRAKSGWSLVLQRRDDDVPDHQAILIGMLETLAFAQRDRHSGSAPSAEEAQAHMMLAAALVGWFSTGAVRME